MLLIDINEYMLENLVKVIVNLLFLVLDSLLCVGCYVFSDDLDNYVFLLDFELDLVLFY